MDEGWTRWVFDTWHVPYVSVVDSVVRAGKLAAQFTVIILPDQAPDELLNGLPHEYPAPYAGGLGADGVKALRQFVQDGGTLVALNDASRFAADKVLLSGWVLHPERIAGKAALVEVKQGSGRVVLFGFRPQYRGQSIATYPLLFNSLQLTAQ